ncbi:hypothetical protein [Bradyrhizobium sp. AUGA SZCCT0042]|uniref:hypothetical protein n=1 Tax=Bradyrhizobium sp. AUGA SZCCT0042 TaxID=2807651 RepID=UPI001BA97CB9|nr:hypothetical protein [Bradyrhizobium sp. AUGA SZCCT0042]MBR1296643.1 hypothetical protein [Bradyrhizobium sp. AUGA SZCCT0042]
MDLQRLVRAQHWRLNKRSSPNTPEVEASLLSTARSMQLNGAYQECIDLLEKASHCREDPRALRLLGLCYHGLAQYAADPLIQTELYEASRKAHENDRSIRLVEVAKTDVNLAALYLTQHRYRDALTAAYRARSVAPNLPTSHVAVLSVHARYSSDDELRNCIKGLLDDYAWVLEDDVFKQHLENDPDLTKVASLIRTMRNEK